MVGAARVAEVALRNWRRELLVLLGESCVLRFMVVLLCGVQ